MHEVRRTYPVFAAATVVGVWLLSGCSQPKPSGPQPGAAKSAVKQKPATAVRFAYQDRVVDAVPIVAIAKGYFREEGLDVKGSRFTSGPACSEALLSGAADFGTMGDATAVIAAAQEAPVKIIASHGNGERRHRILVGKGSSIRTAPDLVGKKLAVKKGTSTYGGLLLWAKKQGLDLKKANIIDLSPGDMPEALGSGAVDALVASEPTPSQLEAKGLGRQLATLGGLGNTYPVLLVVRDRFIEAHPDAVVPFLRAMARAATFLRDHRDDGVTLVAKVSRLPATVAAKAMDRHDYRLRLDDSVTRSLEQTAKFLLAEKKLEKAPDWSEAVAGTWLQQALGHSAAGAPSSPEGRELPKESGQ